MLDIREQVPIDGRALVEMSARLTHLEAENRRLREALTAIRQSSSVDFVTPLVWGQWCRDTAEEALGIR